MRVRRGVRGALTILALLGTSFCSVEASSGFVETIARYVPYHSSSGVTKPTPFEDEHIDESLLNGTPYQTPVFLAQRAHVLGFAVPIR
eukprot:9493519-Pyramimonas_sp.AAC.4